jgi:glucosamine kinase
LTVWYLWYYTGIIMTIRYLLGVDGGGSGTRVRLASSAGERLGFGEGGPSALGQGIEQAWANVSQAVRAAFDAAGLPPAEPAHCAIGLGLAGVTVGARHDAFLRAAPPFARVVLDHDAYTTLLGAHEGRPGIVVAAGTGSVGEVLRPDGTRDIASGWGFPVGDEGSGAWLGLRAVREAQCALDGRAPRGALARAVLGVVGKQRDALLGWCDRAGQHAYAQLAPLVFETEADDPASAALVARAAQDLEAVVHALDPQAILPVVVTGSVGRRLQPRLSAAVRARCVEPAGDSADGALLLLRKALAGPHG